MPNCLLCGGCSEPVTCELTSFCDFQFKSAHSFLFYHICLLFNKSKPLSVFVDVRYVDFCECRCKVESLVSRLLNCQIYRPMFFGFLNFKFCDKSKHDRVIIICKNMTTEAHVITSLIHLFCAHRDLFCKHQFLLCFYCFLFLLYFQCFNFF